MKSRLGSIAVSTLGVVSTYGCILLLMDFGNAYARAYNWSGQSDTTRAISLILFVTLAAIAIACDYVTRPWFSSSRRPLR